MLRLKGFGPVARFLVIGPVRLIFVVEGKPVLLQVRLGQGTFFMRIGVPKGEGGGRDDFPDWFLGDRMRFQWGSGKPLLNLDYLLGFFPVKNDVLENGHDQRIWGSSRFLFPGGEFETNSTVVLEDQVGVKWTLGPPGDEAFDQACLLLVNEFQEFLGRNFLVEEFAGDSE